MCAIMTLNWSDLLFFLKTFFRFLRSEAWIMYVGKEKKKEEVLLLGDNLSGAACIYASMLSGHQCTI